MYNVTLRQAQGDAEQSRSIKFQIIKYARVWWKLTTLTFSADLANRFAAGIYIVGKLIRFLFFLLLLILLVDKTKTLVGYDLNQVIFFFLTFNLIDILIQLLLRGVYHFRPLIVSGDFDLILTKPIHPLFRSLASHADIMDLITLVPLLGYMVYFLISGQIQFTFLGLILYLLLIACSFIIGMALHIMILAIGVLTTEVDHLIWIYRDMTGMGRFPIDIYREWLRNFLIFVVPVGVIMTFPAKALMGLLSVPMILFSIFLAFILLFLSFGLWNFALKKYTSASS
ncbi:MAG: ABC-2 family transporter protein [bacterium]|nr:ABC-2 family transporter protein [bacterium]